MSILGLRAMIKERNVKVERVARAKYALFEHDNIEEIDKFDNVDEYVLNEMKKDKELNDLKYQWYIKTEKLIIQLILMKIVH